MSRAIFSIPVLGLLSVSFLAGCKEEIPAPFCGDGNVDPGEDCDDANAVDTDDCPSTCLDAACGDSFVESGVEECDDANNIDNDACTNDCTNAECGDGIIFNQAGGVENCDDQNQNNNDGCLNDCEVDPIVNNFEITTHKDVVLTDGTNIQACIGYGSSYGYSYCNSYTACTQVFDASLVVNDNLNSTGNYSNDRTCADPAGNANVSNALSGTVTVVTPKVNYTISLTEGATTFTLDCDMNAGFDLNCTDNNNDIWVLDNQ
jgi:cysteine-rich repeat protein